MRVINDPVAEPLCSHSAVTVGKFDGVHVGHQKLIRELRRIAAQRDLEPVVVTFDRHPASLIDPPAMPKEITSTEHKLELLEELGVGTAVVLPFGRDLSIMSPDAFVRDVLVTSLGMRAALVGRDFRFGAEGSGDLTLLQQLGPTLGYSVPVAEDEPGPTGRRASSTWIRESLERGDVSEAASLLGRHHEIRSVVVHGAKRGRELGWPTANLDPSIDGYIPGDGVYAGWLAAGEGPWSPAAISIGNNPTFEGVPERQVEAHVIDATPNLYGEHVRIAFAERIRGMTKFTGLDELKARIAADVDESRTILATAPAPTPMRARQR